MASIPFIGQSYENRSIPVSSQKCINLFPELEPQDARAVMMLQSVSGTSEFADFFGGQINGIHYVTKLQLVIVVANREVFSVDDQGNKTSLGTLPGSGLVAIADNGNEVGFATGTEYYVWDSVGSTFAEVKVTGDSNSLPAIDLTYLDGYFIIPVAGSQQWFITDIGDATTVAALDFEEANSNPDDITAVIAVNNILLFLGPNSYDTWFNSGNAAFPFSKVDKGGANSFGISGTFAKVLQDGIVYYCGADGKIYRTTGGRPQPISHFGIENSLREYSTLEDCEASQWTENGHKFIAFSFPSGDQTWVYDATTQMWHERGSYSSEPQHVSDNIKLWDARFVQPAWNNRNIVASRSRARLGELDLDVFTEYGGILKALRTSPVIHSNQRPIFTPRLELLMETGRSEQTENPQVWLSWSNDGGVTYGNKKKRSLGRIGEYSTRLTWFRLGKSINRVYKLEITDPVRRNIIACDAELQVGNI